MAALYGCICYYVPAATPAISHYQQESCLTRGTKSATVRAMPREIPKVTERTYSEMLRFRMSPEHAALVREAAERASRRKGTGDLSAWIRETLVEAARKELSKEEKKPSAKTSTRGR